MSGLYGGNEGGGNRATMLAPNGAPGPAVAGGRPVVAILVPMTGPRADIGQVLVQAAQLALPDASGPTLDVLDTAGTAAGAAAAAQSAVSHGDGMIIGPLTSEETASVTPIARGAGIPVLAFTNDGSKSQPGVWTLGITPDQQVQRLVAAAQAQGKTQFAALLPDTGFGHAMANALTAATTQAGLQSPTIRTHGAGMPSITAAARDVSGYATRRGPIDAKIKAAREMHSAEGRKEAQELSKTPIPPPSFDALLLADTGENLQEIAAVLPYYDVDRSAVQIVGPSLWADPATGSAAVSGAWFAAPDSAARSAFVQAYTAKYGVAPPSIADLAFDAASVARVAVGEQGGKQAILTEPGGFVGSDGWFTLGADGHVRRGLAVFKVERGGPPEIVDPAPQSASSAGI